MTEPVRIAIAGLGRLGKRHALNLARRVEGAELVAACSPVGEELAWAREAFPGIACHSGYAELLRHPGLQAVFLVTPTALHAEQMIAALGARLHVFCEKPLALGLDDCRRVEAAAAARPELVATVGFVRRFDPAYRDARARIQAGAIGRPYLVQAHSGDANDPSGFFVRFAPSSGGLFMDCSIHDIDLARWLLDAGPARRVWAAGGIALHEGLRDCGDVDHAVATCEFAGGQLASFSVNRLEAHGHDVHTSVAGTAGRLLVAPTPRRGRLEIQDAHGTRHEAPADFFERFEEAFLHEAQDFVDAVRLGRAPALRLEDATEATRIGLALTEALRSGECVTL